MKLALLSFCLAVLVATTVALTAPTLVRADEPRPSDPILTIDPLSPVKSGQSDSITVTAHFRTVEGKPIVGADLNLVVDGILDHRGTTDETGTAFLHFHQDLSAGRHDVEVTFEPTRGSLSWVKQSQASEVLVILPSDPVQLTVEPIASLTAGDPGTVTVVAHLVTADGQPLVGEALTLAIDGTEERGDTTDTAGVAYLRFREDLAIGEHEITVSYEGGRGLLPTRVTQKVTVDPATATAITIAPPSQVIADDRRVVIVVTKLTTTDGQPIVNQNLTLSIDGTSAGSGLTDDSGTAYLRLHDALAAGSHQLGVTFAGAPGFLSTQSTRTIIVLPAETSELTVEEIGDASRDGFERGTIVAHLASATGDPIGQELLEFDVDGRSYRRISTEANGIASFVPGRDLTPGKHHLQVTFSGGDGVVSSSATLDFQVFPTVESVLTLDPVSPQTVGQTSDVAVVAHLSTARREPVAGARITLWLDDAPVRSVTTDTTGKAVLSLRRDLVAGEHRLEATFSGTNGILASSKTTTISVSPAVVIVQVVPPLPDVHVVFDGNTFTSDKDGIVKIKANRTGVFRMVILPWQSTTPGMRATFSRWLDDVFVPYRDVEVPSASHLQVGFATEYHVGMTFLDPDDRSVSTGRISSATLISSNGARFVFQNGDPSWLPGGRIIKTSDGLAESKFFYSVESVFVETSNVVNSKQQKFYPSPNLTVPVKLLLYSAKISAGDAFFGFPVGSGIELDYPDGHSERHLFGPDGTVSLPNLIRGEYHLTVIAPGPAISRPLALTRNVDEHVEVLTFYDLLAASLVALLFAIGLPLIGRPQLRAIVSHPSARLHVSTQVATVVQRLRALRNPNLNDTLGVQLHALRRISLNSTRWQHRSSTARTAIVNLIHAIDRARQSRVPADPRFFLTRRASNVRAVLARLSPLWNLSVRNLNVRSERRQTDDIALVAASGATLAAAREEVTSPPSPTVEHTWECQHCRHDNRLDAAYCSQCGSMAAIDENHPRVKGDPFVLQGIQALVSGNQNSSYRWFLRATKYHPENELGWYWRSRTSPTLEDAIFCLEQIIHLNPENPSARNDLALARRRLALTSKLAGARSDGARVAAAASAVAGLPTAETTQNQPLSVHKIVDYVRGVGAASLESEKHTPTRQ